MRAVGGDDEKSMAEVADSGYLLYRHVDSHSALRAPPGDSA
jgi:hypothetical protein